MDILVPLLRGTVDALKRGNLPNDNADMRLKASMVATKTSNGSASSWKVLHWDYWRELGGGAGLSVEARDELMGMSGP